VQALLLLASMDPLDDGREAHTVANDADLFENSHGVKEWALDPDAARRLWAASLDLIGQP
jgi:hypothetical protein